MYITCVAAITLFDFAHEFIDLKSNDATTHQSDLSPINYLYPIRTYFYPPHLLPYIHAIGRRALEKIWEFLSREVGGSGES